MIGRDPGKPNKYAIYMGLAYSVRDRLIENWIKTQRLFYDTLAKRVYFLSLEFLPGRFLKNYLINLDMEEEAREALNELGVDQGKAVDGAHADSRMVTGIVFIFEPMGQLLVEHGQRRQIKFTG